MAVALGAARPADAGDVGDRVAAGNELPVREPPIHHAVDPVHFIAEARNGVGQLLERIVAEVVGLPCLGTEIGHLPEQPMVDLDARAFVLRIEFAGLAAEILQDRTRLEDRDPLAAGTVVIDDGRHAIVGRDRQKRWLELISFGDIDGDHGVRKPAFFQHDRDLPAVRRRPVIEVDRLLAGRGTGSPGCGGGFPFARRRLLSAGPLGFAGHCGLPRNRTGSEGLDVALEPASRYHKTPAGSAPGRWTAVSRIPYQLIISALVVACREQGGAWLARPA